MNWTAVAQKDFLDAVQSRALWALVVLFSLLSGAISFLYADAPGQLTNSTTASVDGLIAFTSGIFSLFVTITAVVICYKSIAGEREIGSLKLMLSLPLTRRDVFIGKVVGRAGVLIVALLAGMVIGLGVGVSQIGSVEIVPLLVYVVMTAVFALVFVSIIVSISATTGSTTRATTLGVGFLIVLEFVWTPVSLGIYYVVNGFSLAGDRPAWFFVLTQVPPSAAYASALSAILPDVAETLRQAQQFEQFDQFYATPEIGFVFLVFWLVVPIAIGYSRFNNADL